MGKEFQVKYEKVGTLPDPDSMTNPVVICGSQGLKDSSSEADKKKYTKMAAICKCGCEETTSRFSS